MEKNTVPFAVYESAQVKNDRIVKRLVIALIVSIALMFASNAIWLWAWLQFDYYGQEVTVDSNGGDANYIGNNGDIFNGTEGGKKNGKKD